jgi:hypothetical protein
LTIERFLYFVLDRSGEVISPNFEYNGMIDYFEKMDNVLYLDLCWSLEKPVIEVMFKNGIFTIRSDCVDSKHSWYFKNQDVYTDNIKIAAENYMKRFYPDEL